MLSKLENHKESGTYGFAEVDAELSMHVNKNTCWKSELGEG